MPKAAHARNQEKARISPAESAVTLAAALEMLVLVGGLLWAINAPPGTPLWPRILLASAIAILTAVIAILACAPLLRTIRNESKESPPDSDG